jgi:hypothetical protein
VRDLRKEEVTAREENQVGESDIQLYWGRVERKKHFFSYFCANLGYENNMQVEMLLIGINEGEQLVRAGDNLEVVDGPALLD